VPAQKRSVPVTEDLARGMLDDVLLLLSLSDPQRESLAKTLAEFWPSIGDGLNNDEASAIAHSSKVEVSAVASALTFIGYLNTFGALGVSTLRNGLNPEKHSDFEALSDVFSTAALSLTPRFERIRRIARVMPTFQRVWIECDLRQTSDDFSKPEFSSVAIVQFELDEGNKIFFQCTAEALKGLAGKFQQALENITSMDDSLRARRNQ